MIKNILYQIKNYIFCIRHGQLIQNLKLTLQNNVQSIPVFIIAYNNGYHVNNMVEQLNKFNVHPFIFDNASNDKSTIDTLEQLMLSKKATIIKSKKNLGHLIGFFDPIYRHLPEIFAYTDPDLLLNEKLPTNFLHRLSELTKQYDVFKVGFALDLIEHEEIIEQTRITNKLRPFIFNKTYNIREWECKFWRFKLDNLDYQLFHADIDTTFAVYRKSNFNGNFFDAIRIAGDFTAVHLPWFPNLDQITSIQKRNYLRGNISSSWLRG